jgi:hypothetical protein
VFAARSPDPPRARLNGLSLYGLFGLSLSTAVHVGTYLGASVDPDNPLFWGLHMAVFPLFFAFVYRLRAWRSVQKGVFGLQPSRLRWRELLSFLPGWVPPLVVLLFAYVMVNFFLSISHLPSKGSLSSLTAAQAMYTTRAFSGHWLAFYALPTLFFLFVPADARRRKESTDAAVQ